MKKILSLLLLISMLAFSQCGCPDDFLLGNVHLTKPGFFPFKGNEKFTFVNQNGEELVFDQFKRYSTPLIIMQILCGAGNFFVDQQIAYYHTDGISFDYMNNKPQSIQYQYFVNNEILNPTNPADTVLYDLLRIEVPYSVNDFSDNNVFRYVVSDRGNALSPATMEINNNVRVIADTTLNGNRYTDLYCHKSNPAVYYSPVYGVVLFRVNADWWHLKI